MTVYAWPTTLVPRSMQLRVVPNVLTFTAPYSKSIYPVDLMGDYWRMQIELPNGNDGATGGAIEALFDRLKGSANQITLWNFRRPVPLGTARGTMTLAASAAQLANTVSVTGAINKNVLNYGSFEIDSNADGLADGWARYSNGTVGALSASRSTGIVAHGIYSQSLAAASLGSTSADRQGIYISSIGVTSLAGSAAVFSCTVLGTLNSSVMVEVAWRDSGGSIISSMPTSATAMTTGYQVLQFSGACPSNAVTCIIYIYQTSNTGGSPSFYVDGVQLEQGSSATAYAGFATLKAGDMLGINGQLVRVMADATANDAGVFSSVEFAPRLRAAQSSGAGVTWSYPTANFMLLSDGAPVLWQPGMFNGPSAEFREAF